MNMKRGRPKKQTPLDELERIIIDLQKHLDQRDTEDPDWWWELFQILESFEGWKEGRKS